MLDRWERVPKIEQMIIRQSSTRLALCINSTIWGGLRLHQYHIHAALSVSTLASNKVTSKSSPAKFEAPSLRLQQVNRHLSTTQSHSIANMSGYRTRKVGQPFTLDHRVYIEDSHGDVVSPFHDIPLYANDQQTVLNMVVEIPRWTNAKMEVSQLLPMAPIAPADRF